VSSFVVFTSQAQGDGLLPVAIQLHLAIVCRLITRVVQVSVAVPKEFSTVLLMISMDRAFATEFPEIASMSLELCEALDNEATRAVPHELSRTCQSIASTCQFLKAFQHMVTTVFHTTATRLSVCQMKAKSVDRIFVSTVKVEG